MKIIYLSIHSIFLHFYLFVQQSIQIEIQILVFEDIIKKLGEYSVSSKYW